MPGHASDAIGDLAVELTAIYRRFPQVRAIAAGGSQATALSDPGSDLDLYVFVDTQIPLEPRRAIAEARSSRAEVGNQSWGDGDEWVEAATGIVADLIYFGGTWMEEQLDRVLSRHEASVGYSTCFWHTARVVRPLYDRDGWLAALQRRAACPYPEPLRRAVVAANHRVLRHGIGSYRHQIERAVGRGDAVSVNHRVAALLASVFDILFAVNRLPHPGEKRQAAIVRARCTLVPPHFEAQLIGVLASSGSANLELLPHLDALLDGIDDLLRQQDLLTDHE